MPAVRIGSDAVLRRAGRSAGTSPRPGTEPIASAAAMGAGGRSAHGGSCGPAARAKSCLGRFPWRAPAPVRCGAAGSCHRRSPVLDSPTAATVEFALRRLTHEQVGLLASVRDQTGERAAWLAGMPTERLTCLRVGPLAFGAFQSVVRAKDHAGLSRLTIRRLFEAAGGNPFYGLELARVLQRSPSEPSPEEPLPVPADLQGVLSARLAALPDDAQDALLVAACLQSPTATRLEQANG